MLVFATKVADTISKIVHMSARTIRFTWTWCWPGLVGAIVWDLLTWRWRLPTSSSHALIGGLAGAGMAYKGWCRWCTGIRCGRGDAFIPHRSAYRASRSGSGSWSPSTGSSGTGVRWRSTGCFAESATGVGEPSTRWATAATTRRRPWASSWRCLWPTVHSPPDTQLSLTDSNLNLQIGPS